MAIGLARILSSVWHLATVAALLAAALGCTGRSSVRAQQQVVAAIWVDAAGRPAPRADEALAVLSAAAGEGLDPADYDATRLLTMAARLHP